MFNRTMGMHMISCPHFMSFEYTVFVPHVFYTFSFKMFIVYLRCGQF